MTLTARESELLAVTLELLQRNGYEGLTVDQVVAEARASKATVYRRWPTKAELVLAAVMEGVRGAAVAPETGSLRTDLIEIGDKIAKQARAHATTMRAVLVEASRNSVLNDFMQQQMIAQRKKLITEVLRRAVERGEIRAEAVNDDLWDVLPGYLVFRAVIQDRPATPAHGGGTGRRGDPPEPHPRHRIVAATANGTVPYSCARFEPELDAAGRRAGDRRRRVHRLPPARSLRLRLRHRHPGRSRQRVVPFNPKRVRTEVFGEPRRHGVDQLSRHPRPTAASPTCRCRGPTRTPPPHRQC